MELGTAQHGGGSRPVEVDVDGGDHPSRPRRHHGDAVGEEHRLGDRVGDEQRGDRALRPDPLEFDVEALAGHLVEGAEGLVEQQDVGVGDQRAGDRGPLAHPAGQLRRPRPLEPGETDEVDQRRHVGAPAALAGHLEGQSHVALDAAPRKQRRILEGDAQPPGPAQHRRGGTVDGDVAARGLVEIGEDAQHGRLATARRTEEGNELTA